MARNGEFFQPLQRILRQASISCVLLVLSGCSRGYDVELSGPDLGLDTINPPIVTLANALSKSTQAQTFQLSWRILPDKTRRWETLPHSFVYDRRAHTLAFHRDVPYYDLYSGVTDAILQSVAARKGGVRLLLGKGCARTFPTEE